MRTKSNWSLRVTGARSSGMDSDGSRKLERPVTGGAARATAIEVVRKRRRRRSTRAFKGRGATGRSRPCLRARLSVAAPSMKHVTTFSSVCAGTRARSSLPPLLSRAARREGPGGRVAHLERVAARAHLAREHDELDQQLRGAKPRPSARGGSVAIARAPRRAADRSGMTVAATSWCVAGPPSSAICDVLRERGLEGGDATRRARARVDGSGKTFADAARRAGCPSGRTRRAARAATCEGCLDHGRGPKPSGGVAAPRADRCLRDRPSSSADASSFHSVPAGAKDMSVQSLARARARQIPPPPPEHARAGSSRRRAVAEHGRREHVRGRVEHACAPGKAGLARARGSDGGPRPAGRARGTARGAGRGGKIFKLAGGRGDAPRNTTPIISATFWSMRSAADEAATNSRRSSW